MILFVILFVYVQFHHYLNAVWSIITISVHILIFNHASKIVRHQQFFSLWIMCKDTYYGQNKHRQMWINKCMVIDKQWNKYLLYLWQISKIRSNKKKKTKISIGHCYTFINLCFIFWNKVLWFKKMDGSLFICSATIRTYENSNHNVSCKILS